MEFLISNDDGIEAIGIRVLADSMRGLGGVTIVAPDKNCSGASNSLTLDAPIRIKEMADRRLPGFRHPHGLCTCCINRLAWPRIRILLFPVSTPVPTWVMMLSIPARSLQRWKGGFSAILRWRFHWCLVSNSEHHYYDTAGEAAIRTGKTVTA